MSLFSKAMAILFPSRCLICGKAVSAPVCEACRGKVRRIERAFEIDGEDFSCFAPLEYTGGFRRSFHKFKFEGKYALGIQMAALMLEINGEFRPDIIAFVPMMPEKERKRGYNQSELLAKNIAKAMGVPCEKELSKVSDNHQQSKLKAEERKLNVRGVFTVSGDIAGKTILLIDDLVTTGATICECAKALKNAGASEVRGLCVASAKRSEHDE